MIHRVTMSHKSLVVFGILVISSLAFAGAGAPPSPLRGYFKELSGKTGMSEEYIRHEAIESLRSRKLYSETDLARIGRGIEMHPYIEKGMINLLRSNRQFRAKIATAALRNDEISNAVAKEFLTYKEVGFEPTFAVSAEQISHSHSGVRIATARSLIHGKQPGAEILLLAGMKTETLSNQAMAEKVHNACVDSLAEIATNNTSVQMALLDRFVNETHYMTAVGIASALAKARPSDAAVVERIALNYLRTDPSVLFPGQSTARLKNFYGRMSLALNLSQAPRVQAALAEALYKKFDLVALEALSNNGLREKYLEAFLLALRDGPEIVRAEAAKHLGRAVNLQTNPLVAEGLVGSILSDRSELVRYEATMALLRLDPSGIDVGKYAGHGRDHVSAGYRSMINSFANRKGIALK